MTTSKPKRKAASETLKLLREQVRLLRYIKAFLDRDAEAMAKYGRPER